MKSASLSSKLAIATLAGAALSVAAATPITAAPIAAGNCVATATKYKVSITEESTTSGNFVTVGDTVIDFNQGGSGKSCVIVSFSAAATAGVSETMIVRALLDGTTACLPAINVFVRGNATAIAPLADHAMNFVCPSVAPGSHTVKMQFGTANGTKVTLLGRTMLVHYVK